MKRNRHPHREHLPRTRQAFQTTHPARVYTLAIPTGTAPLWSLVIQANYETGTLATGGITRVEEEPSIYRVEDTNVVLAEEVVTLNHPNGNEESVDDLYEFRYHAAFTGTDAITVSVNGSTARNIIVIDVDGTLRNLTLSDIVQHISLIIKRQTTNWHLVGGNATCAGR